MAICNKNGVSVEDPKIHPWWPSVDPEKVGS